MPVFGDFTQTVTIDGSPALVHDLSIRASTSQRVVAVDFVVEKLAASGQDAGYSSAVIGAEVVVTQTVGGDSQTWKATVVDVNEKRSRDYSFKRLQCRSLEYEAGSTRFLDAWEATPASTLVTEAWSRHAAGNLALQGVSLAGVDTNDTVVEEYTSKFDSLYDLMEEVCLLTKWSWRLRNGVLYFFNPLLNIGPNIRQSDYQIEADTLDLKQSLQGVYNVYRMQAWSYTTLTIGRNFEPGDCVDGFLFDPAILKNVEVVGTPDIKQQQWLDVGLEVGNVSADGIIELNKSVFATESLQGQLTIDLELRRLVWVQRLDEGSILLYGRRDAPPISDNGGMNIKAATQYLDKMLAYRATPAADLTLNVLGVGWTPDMVVYVFLDDPAFSAPLYVTDVQRTTDGNDLSVAITLTSPSEIVEGAQVQGGVQRSRSGVDPAYEIGRRVERLERRLAHPAQPLGETTRVFGVFKGAFEATQRQGWAQDVTVVYTGNTNGATIGWSGTFKVVADQDAFLQDTAGWSQNLALNIGQGVNGTAGWSGAVTVATQADTVVGDAAGWSQAVLVENVGQGVGGQTGWTAATSVELLGQAGFTVDDDVVVKQGATIDDDVVIKQSTAVDDDVAVN